MRKALIYKYCKLANHGGLALSYKAAVTIIIQTNESSYSSTTKMLERSTQSHLIAGNHEQLCRNRIR